MQPSFVLNFSLITRARDYLQATALKPQLIKAVKLDWLHVCDDVKKNFVAVEQSSLVVR